MFSGASYICRYVSYALKYKALKRKIISDRNPYRELSSIISSVISAEDKPINYKETLIISTDNIYVITKHYMPVNIIIKDTARNAIDIILLERVAENANLSTKISSISKRKMKTREFFIVM